MKNDDIQYLLRTIVNPIESPSSKLCIVRRIDIENESIVVEPILNYDYNEDTENENNLYMDVKITPFKPIDTSGVIMIPSIGSHVIISPFDNGKYFVSMVSQVSDFLIYNESDSWIKSNLENIDIKAKDTFNTVANKVTVDAEDTIIFNGGENGSFIKISALVSKMNAIENKVNSILSTLNSTVIPLAPSGTYPLSTNFSSIQPITNVQVSDIENDKIKH